MPVRLYDRVDRAALAAPASEATSIPRLAAYLRSCATNEREAARAVYRWITENIAYDTAGYACGNYGDLSAEGVLHRRLSVCSGYARLYCAVATHLGLDAVVVPGLAKGAGFAAQGGLAEECDHAWNAVRVNGRWHLLDSTWGAGHVDEANRFVRRFNGHYFFTDPAIFIFDHLPEAPRWQLLDTPITRTSFEAQVHARAPFFTTGLKLDSHRAYRVCLPDGAAQFSFVSPPGIQAVSHLYRDETKLPNYLTFTQREGQRLVSRLVTPAPGKYRLRLFVGAVGTSQLQCAVEYEIHSNKAAGSDAGFPTIYGAFGTYGARLHSPMKRTFTIGDPQFFRIEVPDAVDVVVACGDTWTPLIPCADGFQGIVSPARRTASIYAQGGGKSRPTEYSLLLRYGEG